MRGGEGRGEEGRRGKERGGEGRMVKWQATYD